ncbi:nucleotide-binding universal stress UspA family protein [Ureibacillus xyleni]|uniref:Universal stress protein n=1 Tax=Ureibacillus xyleni TaxID=614648 RepID=A0A285S772_9BACL|nr:universal stress protein [Ureibacillus xyleni]SOC02715.1 nucleotide-binding universal stress UspA family protein [Ureibacillus xyleni]
MVNNYKNIVVAIDFSEQSIKAFERAVEIAKNNGATLQLVNVIDTKSFGSIAAYDLKYADQLKRDRTEKIEELKKKAQSLGVENVETKVESGSPKEILTQLLDTQLIICGATGVNQVEKMIIGSVAERIVRLAKCDVLIVR